jgi:hypothetical protein
MARDTGCGCSSPRGLRAAADLFISASVFMIAIAVIYIVFTDYSSIEKDALYYEVALLFSSIIFLSASVYLRVRVLDYSDNYKRILVENYDYETSDKLQRSCIERYFSANSYLVVGWLTLIGTVPLILFPVPVFPFIMVFVVLFILLFIVAASPRYLAMNGGRGSICYVEKACDTGGCCACCGPPETQKHVGSDVLIMILALAIFGAFFIAASAVNLTTNFDSITAWLWLLTATLFAAGMFAWHRHSIPRYPAVGYEEPLVSSSSSSEMV